MGNVQHWVRSARGPHVQGGSPLEDDLGEALIRRGWRRSDDDGSLRRTYKERDGASEWLALAMQRAQVVVDGLSYELDFAVTILGVTHSARLGVVLDVEVDGHDHHERTKEQAKRDRSRDRAFTRAGISVVRFTGAEVYADVDACADEVDEIVDAELLRRGSRVALLDEDRHREAFGVARDLKARLVDLHAEIGAMSNRYQERDSWESDEPYRADDGDERDFYETYNQANEDAVEAIRMAARLVG